MEIQFNNDNNNNNNNTVSDTVMKCNELFIIGGITSND